MFGARTIFENSLLGYVVRELQLRYRFKYVLPKLQEITLDGLRFDVSSLSPKIRNRLLSGAYEAHEKEMCLEFLSSRDSVVEVGGAIGFISLLCQRKIGIGIYSSFEANPRTLSILQRNHSLNGLVPRVWNIALGQADGFVDLEVGSDFWENSICYNNSDGDGVKTTRVPSATLETLLHTAGHQPTTLIIDIEGAEQYIDVSHIPDSVQKIIVELHPKVIGQDSAYNIVANLIQLGFRVARERDDTFAFLRK
jgi:FkbM family methyltransferase